MLLAATLAMAQHAQAIHDLVPGETWAVCARYKRPSTNDVQIRFDSFWNYLEEARDRAKTIRTQGACYLVSAEAQDGRQDEECPQMIHATAEFADDGVYCVGPL